MMENRSFDHIFGFRPGVNGLKGGESNLLDPTKPESDLNPGFHVGNGAPFAVLQGQGPGHSLKAANEQLCNNGAGPSVSVPATNNGFVANYHTELTIADKVKNPSPSVLQVVMDCFNPALLPSINALADAFCLCDNWYSEVPGPTQPNRLYMHAATSFGYGLNVWSQQFNGATIYNSIQDAGLSWAIYFLDDCDVGKFSKLANQKQNFKLFDQSFLSDIKTGDVPNYVFIEPRFLNAKNAMANSQHAPQDVRYGDNFIADVYEAIRSNTALWNKSALIVTYDEHGGFYDHVVPPSSGVPNPDGINSPPPGNKLSYAPSFQFDRLGFRVPALIISPWVKAGMVDSTRYQHTSVLATAKKMFGLNKFLTKRDASANTFDQLFAGLSAPRTDTPAKLPRATLPKITVSLASPEHPANYSLDQTQREAMMKVYSLTKPSHPNGPAPDDLPHTQSEASEFMRSRLIKHFGIRMKSR
jgi:phospholipase C